MLLRRALSAYITAFAVVIYYSLLFSSDDPIGGMSRFGEMMQWMSFISLFVFPIVLIYGSFVSFLMEFAAGKLADGAAARMIVSCAGHLVFGALFALPFGSMPFTLSCAASALLFFGMDRLTAYLLARGWRKRIILVVMLLPILAIAAIGVIVGF